MNRDSTAIKTLVDNDIVNRCFLCGSRATVGLQNFLWCDKCASEHLSETLKHLLIQAGRR